MADKSCPPHDDCVARSVVIDGVRYNVIRCNKCGREYYVKA